MKWWWQPSGGPAEVDGGGGGLVVVVVVELWMTYFHAKTVDFFLIFLYFFIVSFQPTISNGIGGATGWGLKWWSHN